jgi:type VI secretion system protein ImpK
MDTVSDLTRECFSAIACLRDLGDAIASPQAVQAQMRTYIDALKEGARRVGLPERDAQDITYALVALMDEAALRAPEPLRSYWMSNLLQFQYFGENAAGEGFFARLDNLLADGRRPDVLRVYELCLLFGFQGRYAFPGGDVELLRIAQTVRRQVEQDLEVPATLSPAGDAPDEPMVRRARRNVLLWVSLGVLALAMAVFVGLRVSYDRQVIDLGSRVDEIAP